MHIIVQKLDPVTRKAWTVKSSDSDEPPSFDALNTFLSCRTRALQELSNGSTGKSTKTIVPKISSATASKTSKAMCPLCKAKHFFSACPTFVRGSPKERHDLVKQHHRCFNCPSQNHSAKESNSTYSCRTCQQRHHSMLHETSDSGSPPASTASAQSASPTTSQNAEPLDSPSTVQSLFSLTQKQSRSHVLLATAWITAGSSSGRSATVQALLDQGSEMTFISERLAQVLSTKRIRMPVTVSAVGCVNADTFSHAAHINVSPRDSQSPSFSTTALILKALTSYTPKRSSEPLSLSHLSDLKWADSDPCSAKPVDIIIAADLYYHSLRSLKFK
ncbi:hypothetical protein DMN91_011500 [Ooceraea biroi]|uniref:Uncharacterized protein n=1 Tax=Ooceraea biroi TaxID=2015173 RepID=A0A3L8D671_OOCBI|nr:hypothetical protein DMN91_011500 [Ooceraea biroi]